MHRVSRQLTQLLNASDLFFHHFLGVRLIQWHFMLCIADFLSYDANLLPVVSIKHFKHWMLTIDLFAIQFLFQTEGLVWTNTVLPNGTKPSAGTVLTTKLNIVPWKFLWLSMIMYNLWHQFITLNHWYIKEDIIWCNAYIHCRLRSTVAWRNRSDVALFDKLHESTLFTTQF